MTAVFAVDNRGLNVAQSVESSDYWQGDEAKWQKTFGNGSGDIHISEVEFDESTGSYQSQVSMPISDPSTGELIGAITLGINVQSLRWAGSKTVGMARVSLPGPFCILAAQRIDRTPLHFVSCFSNPDSVVPQVGHPSPTRGAYLEG